MIDLGIKTDPIENRYSFDWLFDLLAEEQIKFVQVGSFYEIYFLDDPYFINLRDKAEKRGLKIKSVFTAHRELGGFFYDDPHMEKAARRGYEKLIHAATLMGAEFCGSNPGAIYRDRMSHKSDGIACYLKHMKELQHIAKQGGLRALTIEPMSCSAEPPTTPEETRFMMEELNSYHKAHASDTVPVYLCGDISHGMADANKNIVHSNVELFESQVPWMSEFHFKNTDPIYSSTFGFSDEEKKRGIVNLEEFKELVDKQADKWPVKDVVGYLEIGGPKVGRDYSDPLLGHALRESLQAIKSVFKY